jgi:hypothetical protein
MGYSRKKGQDRLYRTEYHHGGTANPKRAKGCTIPIPADGWASLAGHSTPPRLQVTTEVRCPRLPMVAAWGKFCERHFNRAYAITDWSDDPGLQRAPREGSSVRLMAKGASSAPTSCKISQLKRTTTNCDRSAQG